MKFRTVKHHIGTALRNLFLNRLMTIASILTVASCVFIVSVFYLLVVNVNSVFGHLQEQIGLVAFVDDEIHDVALTGLWERIMQIPNVSLAEFVHPDEGIDILEDYLGQGNPLIDIFMEDTPFRRAFSIVVADIQYHYDVVRDLEALEPYGIAGVRNEQDLVDILWNLTRVVQTISIVAILILGLISFVIIINTIRITVSSRQAEIGIMKYVGATDWFIRWPFVIEGAIVGLIGGLIPSGIVWLGYSRVIGAVGGIPELAFIELLDADQIFGLLFPFALTLGALIGLIGSTTAVKRHLKV